MAAATGSLALDKIEHVVVLMLENRSFDHMLGFLYPNRRGPDGQQFDGLTGEEWNPDKDGNKVHVFELKPETPHVYLKPGHDPGEGYDATNQQLFYPRALRRRARPTNAGFVVNFDDTLKATIYRPTVEGTTANDIMGMHTPNTLPVLSTLAKNYAVSDRWFASVPTMTLPNRAFACAATSLGQMDDKTKFFPCTSIFGLLQMYCLDWRVYGYDQMPMEKMDFPDTRTAEARHFGVFRDFREAAASGDLPTLTWLEPSWGTGSNSQAPVQDVALGERYIHDVYYALRESPAWKKTLLFVMYDEHGGCYDHVAPPWGALPPDDCSGQFGFDFTRFGVRVPAVLVSPWIAPGSIVRAPEGRPPFDHTSVLATIEHRWDLSPLSRRDRAAADVGHALNLDQAREDDPLLGLAVPRGEPSPEARPAES